MTDNDPFSQQSGGQGRPWFGRKRFGYGYRPQTWQGYLLTGLCVLFIIIMAAITGGHSPLMALALIPIGVVAIIAAVQGRR
ncbi:MAG TPA: hypothetical protein VK823_23365 [Streptosporangiaceae bacterium]|jgi:hypothetical protein|nr:hypothetical protein [Streptosporangiaceae bacterium]